MAYALRHMFSDFPRLFTRSLADASQGYLVRSNSTSSLIHQCIGELSKWDLPLLSDIDPHLLSGIGWPCRRTDGSCCWLFNFACSSLLKIFARITVSTNICERAAAAVVSDKEAQKLQIGSEHFTN